MILVSPTIAISFARWQKRNLMSTSLGRKPLSSLNLVYFPAKLGKNKILNYNVQLFPIRWLKIVQGVSFLIWILMLNTIIYPYSPHSLLVLLLTKTDSRPRMERVCFNKKLLMQFAVLLTVSLQRLIFKVWSTLHSNPAFAGPGLKTTGMLFGINSLLSFNPKYHYFYILRFLLWPLTLYHITFMCGLSRPGNI